MAAVAAILCLSLAAYGTVIAWIKSHGAFDAARDWRDAYPEGPEVAVLRQRQEQFVQLR
jgi:hypothetical protein